MLDFGKFYKYIGPNINRVNSRLMRLLTKNEIIILSVIIVTVIVAITVMILLMYRPQKKTVYPKVCCTTNPISICEG